MEGGSKAAVPSRKAPAPGRGILPEDAGAVGVFGVPDADSAAIPGSGFADSCRPAGEYSGYTWFHLPDKNGMPPWPRSEEASLAIFAARIAFSSFPIRSRER